MTTTEPGTFCPRCGEKFYRPTRYGYEWVEAPHTDLHDCIGYLRSRMEDMQSSIDDLRGDVFDLRSEIK